MSFRRSPSRSRRAKGALPPGPRSPSRARQRRRLGFEALDERRLLATLAIEGATVTEGDAGTVDAVFNVVLTPEGGDTNGAVVTVNFSTADGTAIQPDDYTMTSGTLSFTLDGTMQTQAVTVAVAGDLLDEPNETFEVNLSGAVGATITDPQAQGIIEDNDPTPTLSIDDESVTEGDAGSTNMVFTVTLSAASGQPVTVEFATSDATATQPADYLITGGTLSFAPGTTTQLVTVAVNGDVLDEVDETFEVNLSSPANATLLDGQGIGTIGDNDPQPTISISDQSVTEGNAGTTDMVFTVTLSAASGQEVTVQFATGDGTATQPADYLTTGGTLTFAPGTTTQLITVAVNGDVLDEVDETFEVNLSSPANATLLDGQGIGTIGDNDPQPTIAINDQSVTEGDIGSTNMVFTVTLSAASGQPVTVQFSTADATATQPADYLTTSGTLTFAPGTTTQLVTVAVNGDVLDESNETFVVNLSTAANATILDPQGIGTIVDNDPQPTLVINDQTVMEGDAGSTNMVFTVTLSAVSGQPVTVQFATADATATQPSDYTATSGTLTFAPGTTTQLLTVAVNGDLLDEPNETFVVNLSSPVNATIGDAIGVGAITDNDPPMVSINDVAQAEGDEGTTNMVFTVSLSSPSGAPVTVLFNTSNGSAISPNDYTPQSGTVSFAAGETQRTITIAVRGETTHEIDETFFVTLTTPSGANLGDQQGVGLILNDDFPQFIVTGASQGGGPRVRVFNPNNGQAVHDFYAYDPTFLGGVSVATADFNMDGVADIVTGAGPGGGPHVRVFDGETGQQLPGPIGSFFAYSSLFTGGVFVAAADLNGDDVADIITGAGAGGGPHVRVFNGANGAVLADFFAYDPSFLGGVRVAAAQVVTGGNPEIITAAGPGGGPHVRVFTSAGTQIPGPAGSFFAYDPAFGGGVYVAAADVNDDGQVDIITGAGQGGGPHVRTFNGATGVQLAEPAGSFFAFEPSFAGGVRVGAGNITGDGGAEIITGAGPGGTPRLRAFRGPDLAVVSDFPAYETSFSGGLFVAGTTAGLSPGGPLLAAPTSGAGGDAAELSNADLSSELVAALQRRLGVSLEGIRIAIADLPAGFLGHSDADGIVLDRDAAGLGWFVDPTPLVDEEFGISANAALPARAGSAAAGRIDLLTALAHEIAHLRGFGHVDAADHLLSATLSPGQRRISPLDLHDEVLASDW